MLRLPLTFVLAILLLSLSALAGDPVPPLKGEYKEINTSRESKAIATLLEGTDEQKEKAATKIQKRPSRYAPVVFFHLATYCYD